MSKERRLALAAGVLYLVTHVTSVGAVLAYGGAIDDPFGGGASHLARGAALEVVLALACLGTGVLLLPILSPGAPVAARAFAAMRTMEAAVIAAGTIPVMAVMWLTERSAGQASATRQGIGEALGAAHDAAFLVGQGLIISVNTFVLAWALWRARVVPLGLPVLGAIGAAFVLTSNLLQLFGAIEFSGTTAGALAAPVFAFELWLAGYLLFVGVRATTAVPTPVG